MKSLHTSAVITMCQIKHSDWYNHQIMLTLSITYPQAELCCNRLAEHKINRQIQAQVKRFCSYACNSLSHQAIASHLYAQKNGFPFHPYEAVLQYEIPYNQNCHLSLYRDQYEFTGGAHGNTIRSSSTWNLADGTPVSLSSLFPCEKDYRRFLIGQIQQQADRHMQQDSGVYFEDYRTLIENNFQENHFYLTPDGLAVYYQQYEIAPYSTGIVVFTIPYQAFGSEPSCPQAPEHPISIQMEPPAPCSPV